MHRPTARPILATALAAACGAPDPSLPPVIADNVFLIDDALAARATVEPDRIVFPEDAAEILDRRPGDILVSGHGAGLLRRVAAVAPGRDRIVVETGPAALTDAVVQGEVHATLDLAGSGSRRHGEGPGLDAALEFSDTLLSAGGCRVDLVKTARLEAAVSRARLEFSPSLDVDLAIRDRRIERFELAAGGAFEAELAVALLAEGDAGGRLECDLYRSPRRYDVLLIGWLPLVIETGLDLAAGLEVTAGAEVEAEIGGGVAARLRAGVRREAGRFVPVAEHEARAWRIGPTFDGEARVRVRPYLRPELATRLYGVAGPSLAIEPYAEIDRPSPRECELTLGVAAHAGGRVRVLDHTLGSLSLQLFDRQWEMDCSGEAPGDAGETEPDDGTPPEPSPCCEATGGCPSETSYGCPGDCCCCPSGSACDDSWGYWACG